MTNGEAETAVAAAETKVPDENVQTSAPAEALQTEEPADIEENEEYSDHGDEDLVPEEGDLLEPGDYLVELETIRALPREIMAEGFRRHGFAEVRADLSIRPHEKRSLVHEHRFLGRLARPIRVRNQDDARWTYARKLKMDALATDLRFKLTPFSLVPGKLYECRFLSRMRTQPTRAMVENDLSEMGWDSLHLSALRSDTKIPGRTNASVTLWFGIMIWDGPESMVSEDDPFYFEDVVEVS